MDLYSPLFKWAHRQGENFTTDAFCFLLREMLARESDSAYAFLNWLCFDTSNILGPNNVPTIDTQIRSIDGVPDIAIAAPNVYVIVEVKKGSDLHTNQLARYHRMLKVRGETRTSLVLLTASQANYDPAEKPHRELRWGDVERRIASQEFQDPIISYLVSQFISFLKGQVMAVEQVGWQLVEGTKSLVHFTDMLNKALENESIPVYQGSSAWASRGHYTKGKNYWVGVFLNYPSVLHFMFEDARPKVDDLVQLGWEMLDKNLTKVLDLESEECHFFARTKEQQLDELQRFVKLAHEQAEANKQ